MSFEAGKVEKWTDGIFIEYYALEEMIVRVLLLLRREFHPDLNFALQI